MPSFRHLILVPLIALIAACGGTVYNVPAEEAQARLVKAKPPLEMAEALHERITVARTTEGGVMWVLTNSAGVAIAQAWVEIEPSGKGAAEVTLDDQTLDNGADGADPKLFELFRLAIREHVDSTLTNRQFEIAALGTEMMGEFVNQSFQQTSKELEESMSATDYQNGGGADWAPDDDSGDQYHDEQSGFPPDAAGVSQDPDATTSDMGDETWGANAQH